MRPTTTIEELKTHIDAGSSIFENLIKRLRDEGYLE